MRNNIKRSNRLTFKLFLLGTALSAGLTAHAFELVPHSATYSANITKGISIKGEAVRELKKLDEKNWLYRFDVQSFAADIDESVVFSEENKKITPASYRYQLSPFLARDKKRNLIFNWETKSVENTAKKGAWLLNNIPSNTYDRLSYQLQLLLDIESQQLPTSYQIAHKAKLRPSEFEVIGEEVIDTKLGKAAAVVVKKSRAEGKKRQTHLWVSKKYPMLLLKMVQIEKDGEEYEIHLSHATVDGKNVSFNAEPIVAEKAQSQE